MDPLFSQIVPDSGGGIRTISDVWPLLLAASLVLGVVVSAIWRFLVLTFSFVCGNVPRGWQAVELACLFIALFVLCTFVAWAIGEVWLL